MRILIVFGTTEGHTRELCQFVARCLKEAGAQATLEEATPETNARALVGRYDAVLLAGSLHVGHYQPALVAFARLHHELLAQKPSGFFSVSLSAAGHNADDWEGLEDCLKRFEHETLWTPDMVHQAAGAIRYSQYDFFKRLAIQHIARARGQETVRSRDYDLTDYDALRDFALAFLHMAAQRAAASEPRPPAAGPA